MMVMMMMVIIILLTVSRLCTSIVQIVITCREKMTCVWTPECFGDDTKTFQELSVGSELSVCVESYDEEDSEEAM